MNPFDHFPTQREIDEDWGPFLMAVGVRAEDIARHGLRKALEMAERA